MDAAVAALIGAGIGALASLAGAVLQQKYQAERAVVSAAVKLGLAEFENDVEMAKAKAGITYVPPPSAYVAYNAQLLRAISKNKLTPGAIEAIDAEHQKLLAVIGGKPE
jgi:hypothetical protein